MKHAVIQTGGKQYQVAEGETIAIEKLAGKPKDKLVFDQVLLIFDGKSVQIGQPVVNQAQVIGEIIDQTKGDKVRIAKFRAKSRYRLVKGHRQLLTLVKIKQIKLGSSKT